MAWILICKCARKVITFNREHIKTTVIIYGKKSSSENVFIFIFNECSQTNPRKYEIVNMGDFSTSLHNTTHRFSFASIIITFHKWQNIQKQSRNEKRSYKIFQVKPQISLNIYLKLSFLFRCSNWKWLKLIFDYIIQMNLPSIYTFSAKT